MDSLTTLDHLTEGLARALAARTGRRTLLGRVGRTLTVAGVATMGLTLTPIAFRHESAASHCIGYHAGYTCPSRTSCASNPGALLDGGCWYACCPAECGGAMQMAEICDCCDSPNSGDGGYCPSGTAFACKIPRCIYSAC